MFLDLLLDTCLQLVQIGITKPVGAGLHSARERIGNGGDTGIVGDRDR